jgi:predicted transcriptional regulator
MTNSEIKAVLDRVLTWPAEKQEVAADFLRMLDSQTEFYEPTEEEMAAIEEGLAQAERGEFASDEEVAALWRKFGV